MITAIIRDVHDPETWHRSEESDRPRMLICPSCIVPVPDSVVQDHIDKRHSIQVREGIVHLGRDNLDSVVIKGYFNAPYREQLAAIHAQEGWRPEDVEKVMSTIYQAKQTGRLDILEGTWDLTQRVALDWYAHDGSPV